MKINFKESLFTRRPYLQRLRAARTRLNDRTDLNEWGHPDISKTAC